MSDGARFALRVALGLVAAALVAYHPVLSSYFQRDDFAWLYDAQRQLADPTLLWTWRPNNYFRPLSNLVFTLEYAAFGLEPRGYFAVAIALHAWNAYWLFRLGALWFGDRTAGVAAGLLFCVLRRPSPSVLWISGLVTLLAAAALLPALVCHLRYLRTGAKRFYWAAFAGVAAAALAKESGVVVGPLMLLVELFERGPRSFLRPATWRRYLPFVALGAAYVAVQASFLDQSLGRSRAGPAELLAVVARGQLINWAVFANPVRAFDAALASAPVGATAQAALLALLALGGGWARLRQGLAAVLFTAVALLPLSLFLSGQDVLTARYTYLPCLGVALALGLLFGEGARAARRRGGALGRASVFVALALVAGLHALGTVRTATTQYLYAELPTLSRQLVSSVDAELGPAVGEPRGSGRRWVVIGPPLLNPRHFQCLVALRTELSPEAVRKHSLRLDGELRAALARDGSEYFRRRFRAERVLVWPERGGLVDAGDGRALWPSLTRSWRWPPRKERTAVVYVVAF